MWKTKNEPINALFKFINLQNPELDKKTFLKELKDMNTYLYICEYGENTCEIDLLINIYLKEKEKGLQGFAEGIYDAYPEYFIEQLKLRNQRIIEEKSRKKGLK